MTRAVVSDSAAAERPRSRGRRSPGTGPRPTARMAGVTGPVFAVLLVSTTFHLAILLVTARGDAA